MITPISNITDTLYRNIHKQKMNILYQDAPNSCISTILTQSEKLNFIRTQKLDNDILSMDYSVYFSNDYLSLEKNNNDIITNMHTKSVICFSETPLPTLKKEDFYILNKNLYLSKKITFCPFIYDIWKKFIDIDLIEPGIPNFEVNNSQERKPILIVSSNNKEQARLIRDQISQSVKDVGLYIDFNNNANHFIQVINNYKLVIVLDDAISALLALSANCSVVSPYKFYKEVFTYDDSSSFNNAVVSGLELYDSKKTRYIGPVYRERYNFNRFDDSLYEFVHNLTKRPFIL